MKKHQLFPITLLTACMVFFNQFTTAQTFENAFFRFDNRFNNGEGDSHKDNLEGDLIWGASYHMMAFMTMYRSTGDVYYLKKVITFSKNVINQRDDNQGRTDYRGVSGPTWVESAYSENSEPYAWVVGSGMITYPMADFAQLVINTPALHNEISTQGNTFLSEANWLVSQIQMTINAHEDEWDANLEVYRFRNTRVICCPGEILPHNQYAAMGRTLLMMYKATYDSTYLEKTIALAKYFKKHLKNDPAKNAYVWNYKDPEGWIEDISHAAIEVNFAYLCHQNQIVFTATDMEKFTNTLFKKMYPEPGIFAINVDGTGDQDDWFNALQVARLLCLSDFEEDIYQAVADLYMDRALYFSNEKNSSLLLGLANCGRYKKLLNPLATLRYSELFQNNTSVQWAGITVGDFDKNGRNDIILADRSRGQFYRFDFDPMRQNLKLSETTTFINTDAKWAGISSGDFNNDGVVEFVGVNNRDGQFYLFAVENRKIVQKAVTQLENSSLHWVGLSSGDFDNDGVDEFVAVDNSDGCFYIFEVENGKIVKKAITQPGDCSAQWSGVSAGDFDNDGVAEIVASSTLEGQFYMFELVNDTLINKSVTDFLEPNSEWVGITSGDFDGDDISEFASISKLDGDVHFFEFESGKIKFMEKESFPGSYNLSVIGSGKIQSPSGIKDDLLLIRSFDYDLFIYQTLLEEDQVTTSVDTGSKPDTYDFIETWYPNPSNDLLYVKLKENVGKKVRLEVFDSLGRTMIKSNDTYSFSEQRLFTVHIKDFETGIYYLRLGVDNARFQVIKFVKK